MWTRTGNHASAHCLDLPILANGRGFRHGGGLVQRTDRVVLLADRGRQARLGAAGDIAVMATLSGLLTGFAHALVLAFTHHVLHQFTWFSREFVWMAPSAYAALFLLLALPLFAAAALVPARVTRGVIAWYFAVLSIFALLLPYPQIGRASALVLSAGAAVQLARVVGRRDARWRARAMQWVLALACLGAAISFLQPLARSGRERMAVGALPPAAAGAPNVLYIILDTVRAASLSLYGFSLPTTPALERWAAEGTTFNWAIAPAPWTLPSHASMFTGRYPGELTLGWTTPLDDAVPTLAEVLRSRGYHTMAISANHDYAAWDSGLDRGFVHFEDYRLSWRQWMHSTSYTQTGLWRALSSAGSVRDVLAALRDGDLSIEPKHRGDPRRASSVTRRFLRWQERNGARPFFAFLNYFDAHQGYYAPPGFPRVGSGKGHAYQTAIRWIDQNLDSLFTVLRARGVLDRTLVIVTSDHGELFDEHGISGHANNLYRNVLRVPLVMRLPGVVPAGQRVERQVSLRDLPATIADMIGMDGAPFPGASLRLAWSGGDSALSPALAEVQRAPNVDPSWPTARGDVYALFDDSYHYIQSSAGDENLDEYRTDSLEERDLIGPTNGGVLPVRDRLALLRQSYGREP